MEFIERLVVTEESIRMKGTYLSFSDYEDRGFRINKRVKIDERVGLSIQASYSHYCSPRKTIDIEDYTDMELAIFEFGEFVSIDKITDNESLIHKFGEYYEGTVYGYVPVELIEELYQELI